MKDKHSVLTSLETSIDSMPVPVIVKDAVGNIVHANQTWKKFFGYERSELPKDVLQQFLSAEDLLKEAHRDRQTLLSSEPQVEEIWYDLDDKGRYLMEVTRSPLFDEHRNAAGILCVFHDVSGFNWALEELKHNLTACIEREQLGRQVLARLGHRIGTPLNAVQEGFEHLSRSDLNRKQNAWVSSMREVINDLHDHVDKIVELSSLQLGYKSLQLKSIDMDSLIHGVMDSYRPLAQSKCLNFIYEGDVCLPLQVKADEDKLKELMNILVKNAIDYTDEGVVKIRAELDRRFTTEEFTAVKISVSDTGSGIDTEDQKNIFTPYFDKPNKGQGHGIGLAIAQTVCKTLGSILKVSSVPGRGSSFYCTLIFKNVKY